MKAGNSSTVSSSLPSVSAELNPNQSPSSVDVILGSVSSQSSAMNSSQEMPPLSSASHISSASSGVGASSSITAAISMATSNNCRPSTDSAGVNVPYSSITSMISRKAIGSMSSLSSSDASAIAAITSVCVVVVVIEKCSTSGIIVTIISNSAISSSVASAPNSPSISYPIETYIVVPTCVMEVIIEMVTSPSSMPMTEEEW